VTTVTDGGLIQVIRMYHCGAEFLIDCEEDRMLRAVLVGMLREG
jgi:hypothetical protein